MEKKCNQTHPEKLNNIFPPNTGKCFCRNKGLQKLWFRSVANIGPSRFVNCNHHGPGKCLLSSSVDGRLWWKEQFRYKLRRGSLEEKAYNLSEWYQNYQTKKKNTQKKIIIVFNMVAKERNLLQILSELQNTITAAKW